MADISVPYWNIVDVNMLCEGARLIGFDLDNTLARDRQGKDVADVVGDESKLEAGWLIDRLPVQLERLGTGGIARLEFGERIRDEVGDELQGLEDVGFSGGVGPVDRSALEQLNPRQPRQVGSDQAFIATLLVIAGDQAERLLVPNRAEVGDLEFDKHDSIVVERGEK